MRYKLPLVILTGIGVSLFSPSPSLQGQEEPSPNPAHQTAAEEKNDPLADEKNLSLRSREEALLIGEAPDAQARSPGSFRLILQMIIVLVLCAGAIYGVILFFKKIAKPPETQDPYLKVLGSAHLGANRFVHVVSVGSQAWVVGASEGGVSLIAEITDPETVDAMLLEASRKNAETEIGKLSDFARLLRRFTGKEAPPIQPDLSVEKIRKRREHLRGL
ncbi:MAG: flagellar biosynthetic protein FliO [Spirochaetaceae bacterium]|jgi:flagellar protein FliO/FliZ|nr:flagellar biosynthetic protein FliO [Spirochaetaceae bacterium]